MQELDAGNEAQEKKRRISSRQKLVVVLGVVVLGVAAWAAVGVWVWWNKGLFPNRYTPEAAERETEKYLGEQLKPAIEALKSRGKVKLGLYELEGTHAGGARFKEVTLTLKSGDKLEAQYQAARMELVFKQVPTAVLAEGRETTYEGGEEQQTTAFAEKEVLLVPLPQRPAGLGRGAGGPGARPPDTGGTPQTPGSETQGQEAPSGPPSAGGEGS